ncbi:MAG: hypothetical protein GXY82_02990 [Methanospirillum sp.]|nr:hypothetical protein [Methanospirillum sp.]
MSGAAGEAPRISAQVPPNFDAIPMALREYPQWVLWRSEHRADDPKPTKVPCYVKETDDGPQLRRASTTDPTTWCDFETVLANYERWHEYGVAGIGFVFSANDPFVGIDIDTFNSETLNLARQFGSYAETSQSGNGLHVIVKGRKPGKKCRHGPYELYDAGRFFVMTGKHIAGTPDDVVEADEGSLEEFYRQVEPESDPESIPTPKAPSTTPKLSDKKIIELARGATNGTKFSALFDAGSTAEYEGDDSRADAALCAMLAFYTQDAGQIDRIFRASALLRDKWNEPRGSKTYGEVTIDHALGLGGDTYTPPKPRKTQAVVGVPTPEEIPVILSPGEEAKPTIRVDDRQLGDIAHESTQALLARNAARPSLFIRAGIAVRVDRDEKGRPVVRILTDTHMRGEMAAAAKYVTVSAGRSGEPKVTAVFPPMAVARHILTAQGLCALFPSLRGIIESPSIGTDGNLITRPGYDPVSGLYYAPCNGFTVPEVPEHPTTAQIAEAGAFVKECVCDFPFVVDTLEDGTQVEASRANAIAGLISTIVRPMIRGRTPLLLFDKPQSGTGASLLAEFIVRVATGTSAAMTQIPENGDEWDKRLLAELMEGRTVIVFDNITGVLKARQLATAITQPTYNGRILGQTQMARVDNCPCWIATGINITLGGDLPRRAVWIKMNADDPRPWLRKVTFTHTPLLEWGERDRGRIIAAILTLARAWHLRGRPVPKETPIIGGFEDWCRVLGGILYVAGIDGFLLNLDKEYEEGDVDGPQWGGFLAKWHAIHGEEPITVAALVRELMQGAIGDYPEGTLFNASPDELRGALTGNGPANKRIGEMLRSRKETRFDTGYKLVRAKTKEHGAARWVVVNVCPAPAPFPSAIPTSPTDSRTLEPGQAHL